MIDWYGFALITSVTATCLLKNTEKKINKQAIDFSLIHCMLRVASWLIKKTPALQLDLTGVNSFNNNPCGFRFQMLTIHPWRNKVYSVAKAVEIAAFQTKTNCALQVNMFDL